MGVEAERFADGSMLRLEVLALPFDRQALGGDDLGQLGVIVGVQGAAYGDRRGNAVGHDVLHC